MDRKRTALARPARDPDGRAVPIGDPLGQGKAQTGAVGMPRPCGIDPVEAFEEMRKRVRRDADASVAHIEPGGAVFTRHTERDTAVRRRELDGVSARPIGWDASCAVAVSLADVEQLQRTTGLVAVGGAAFAIGAITLLIHLLARRLILEPLA
jgi:hypothetical protein